jgi:hypothetical protein
MFVTIFEKDSTCCERFAQHDHSTRLAAPTSEISTNVITHLVAGRGKGGGRGGKGKENGNLHGVNLQQAFGIVHFNKGEKPFQGAYTLVETVRPRMYAAPKDLTSTPGD